jgi:sulfur-oxidizing protein SoxY
VNSSSKESGRRLFLKSSSSSVVLGLAMCAGLIRMDQAWAAPGYKDRVFSMSSLGECMKALGSSAPRESNFLTLSAPDVAENGALVPVDVWCGIPNTQEVALLVRHNPSVLAAHFEFPQSEREVKLSTRLKMARSSDVFVWVRADGHYYFSKKEVRVTLGGCAA